MRLAVLTDIVSPYRVPVFNCLAQDPRIDLEVLFFAESGNQRGWRVPWEQIRFRYQVLPGRIVGRAYQRFPLFLNPGIASRLRRGRYDAIVCGGYHHPSSWLVMSYASVSRTRSILWSESTCRDLRRHSRIQDWLKRSLIGRFDGYVLPGTPQREYLSRFGVRDATVWLAPNAVDNRFFTESAARLRPTRGALRREEELDGFVVLYVGRLIDAKGIPDLMQAIERVRRHSPATLLLVGDGPDAGRYRDEARARRLPVRFTGFRQQEDLPRYYAMADVLVLPTYSDPWGLVINEAMASGLPVIASSAAGAARDLVAAGENGHVYEPGDVDALVTCLADVRADPSRARAMGIRSQQIIQGYSPERCAHGFAAAALGERQQSDGIVAASTRAEV